MFDYSLAHWLAFLTAAFLLNLSPGPDMAFILGQTARDGIRTGFAAMFGIWSGAFLHVVFAAIGLSAIVATSATAFAVVKWIGAGYLVWLGIQAWRSNDAEDKQKVRSSTSRLAIFRQGVLVAALNPKVAIFFLAFLPQFVVKGAGPASMQLFLHGALIIVVAGVVEPPLVVIGGKLSGLLKGSPRVGQLMERVLGSIFIALGVKLALSNRVN